jgi:hypothetical protein
MSITLSCFVPAFTGGDINYCTSKYQRTMIGHGIGQLIHVLLAFILVVPVGSEKLSLNSRCALSDDLSAVEHDPSQRTVQMHYLPSRRCTEPVLLLRLSGSALYKLHYEGLVNDTQTFRYPPIIDDGRYFIEAVILYCSKYDFGLQVPCMEDTHYGRNVVTGLYSFDVSAESVPKTTQPSPRWILSKNSHAAPTALATRHQRLVNEPRGNLKCDVIAEHYCLTDLDEEIKPYLAYEWVDGPTWIEQAKEVISSLTTATSQSDSANAPKGPRQLINICFVGDSHSRMLYVQAYYALQQLKRAEVLDGVAVTYIFALFPPLFEAAMLEEHHCSVAVLSFGIWPLSSSPVPYTAHMHRQQMQELLSGLISHGGAVQLFTRSENINGLGLFVDFCPGMDRRSPPAFDAVNLATKQVSESQNIPFIDLDPISYPMWDAAHDYCHPPGPVFSAEVSFILHKVFANVLAQRKPLTTFPASSLVQEVTDWHSPVEQRAAVVRMQAFYGHKGRKTST